MRSTAIESVGGVDPSRHYAMDYDLWLRLGKRYPPGLIDKKIGRFRMHETSKSITGFQKQFDEDLEVAQKYANGHGWPIFWHRLNNKKIVMIYQLLARVRKIQAKPACRQAGSET